MFNGALKKMLRYSSTAILPIFAAALLQFADICIELPLVASKKKKKKSIYCSGWSN